MLFASGRNFISRKALGLTLKARREAFAGADVDQTLSKIKSSQTVGSAYYPKTNKSKLLSSSIESVGESIKSEKSLIKRFAGHGLLLASVALIFGYSSMASGNSLGVLDQSGGVGVSNDRISMLQTGAVLAVSTNSVIATDIKAKAETASSQVYLATAGDSFLAKRQPVSTAGTPARDITTYHVADGDTIWSIAGQFNITTDTLKWANDLSDDSTLKPGSALTILPVNGILFTAQGGDDINAIADKYRASSALIDSYNELEGNAPTAGQKLIIPDGVMPEPPKPVVQIATTNTAIAPRAVAPNFTPIYGGYNGYAYGYCTWYVASRRSVPSNWGNAVSWYGSAQASGFGVSSAPAPGAIAWERGNHVAYVESVSGGMVTVSEMNYWSNGGGWNRVSYRTVPASSFLYIY